MHPNSKRAYYFIVIYLHSAKRIEKTTLNQSAIILDVGPVKDIKGRGQVAGHLVEESARKGRRGIKREMIQLVTVTPYYSPIVYSNHIIVRA